MRARFRLQYKAERTTTVSQNQRIGKICRSLSRIKLRLQHGRLAAINRIADKSSRLIAFRAK